MVGRGSIYLDNSRRKSYPAQGSLLPRLDLYESLILLSPAAYHVLATGCWIDLCRSLPPLCSSAEHPVNPLFPCIASPYHVTSLEGPFLSRWRACNLVGPCKRCGSKSDRGRSARNAALRLHCSTQRICSSATISRIMDWRRDGEIDVPDPRNIPRSNR